jgi:ABC-2 type transport system ATP-binding protein
VWEIIRVLVAQGTSVLLTTQYLDEADQLAERIAVIDHGKVIAEGTSSELKASVGAGSLHVRLGDATRRDDAARVLAEHLDAEVRPEADPAALSTCADDPERVGEALTALARAGIVVSEFALGQPSLDEVFLALTGHPAESPDDDAGDDATTQQEDAA